MYLLDTDIISNLLKKASSPRLLAKVADTPPDQQFTSAINIGELVYGTSRRPDADFFLKRIREKTNCLNILPFDEDCALVYGKMKASLEKEGISLGEPDLRIASIALSHKMTMVTGNVKHFSLIPDLPVENWL